MTLRTGEDILIWRRRFCIALYGGIVLEEALDLLSHRILNEWNELFGIINGVPIEETRKQENSNKDKTYGCSQFSYNSHQFTPPLFSLLSHHQLCQTLYNCHACWTFLTETERKYWATPLSSAYFQINFSLIIISVSDIIYDMRYWPQTHKQSVTITFKHSIYTQISTTLITIPPPTPPVPTPLPPQAHGMYKKLQIFTTVHV